jgi:hypothetical protein
VGRVFGHIEGLASATTFWPPYQHLSVGDLGPEGPPASECGFTVVDVVPQQRLVLSATSHLPLSWREPDLAGVVWAWAFVLWLVENGNGMQLVFRWRALSTPGWLTFATQVFVVPADYLMSRAML